MRRAPRASVGAPAGALGRSSSVRRWLVALAIVSGLALLALVPLPPYSSAQSAISRAARAVVKTSTALARPCGPRAAWVGAGSDGVACFDTAGWKLFGSSASSLKLGFVKDFAVCSTTGVVWTVASSGLFSTDGRRWTKHQVAGYPSFDAVACDSKGRVWLGGYKIAAVYSGSKLTTYPVSKLGTGRFVDLVKDVAVAPDGRVWFATANSVATYDGSKWTYFEKGHGLDKEYFFNKLAVDRRGRVWAATTSDILSYDGQAWASVNADYWQGQALAIDRQDRLVVGTYSHGLAVLNGQTWTMYDRANSGLPSNYVKSVAVDGRGRIWVGTSWGLAVLDGTIWRTYHVSDSNIPADEVSSLGIVATGPPLPPKLTKKLGGLRGRLVRSGVAQAGLHVELCVEYLGSLFSLATPCTGQPFTRATTTLADGSFEFPGLPAGDYVIAFQDANAKWFVLSNQFGLGSSKQKVLPGRTTNLGQLDVAKAK